MKVCIVTVYDSINSGSFWQARVLGGVIESLGCEACYYQRVVTRRASSSAARKARRTLGLLLKQGPAAALRYGKILRGFRRCRDELNIVSNADERALEGIDCFVLGSDTIWNLDGAYFRDNVDVFFGRRFLPRRVVTYAASAANAAPERFAEIPGLAQTVSQWAAIGVRDPHTRAIIAPMAAREVELVCDPTLLYARDDYMKLARRPQERPYAFVYLFKPLDPAQGRALRAFCRARGLEIVNGANARKPAYCDRCVGNAPDVFMNYVCHADCVITDTFHGTMFSVNLNKRFAVMARGKKKVDDFIAAMGLADHLVPDGGDPTAALAADVDYAAVNAKLDALRANGTDFLRRAIGVEGRD